MFEPIAMIPAWLPWTVREVSKVAGPRYISTEDETVEKFISWTP